MPNIISSYQCTVCKEVFRDKEEAIRCEAHPITQDKGVKVGDRVRITGGAGKGKTAIVKSIDIAQKNWGHRSWGIFWHTPLLIVDIENDWGSRLLSFDDYEVI